MLGAMCVSSLVMKLTKNTNKATRAWVDSILSQLDLVLCEYNYRDAYDALKSCQLCGEGKEGTIQHLTEHDGCAKPSDVEHAKRLSCSGSLGNFLDQL